MLRVLHMRWQWQLRTTGSTPCTPDYVALSAPEADPAPHSLSAPHLPTSIVATKLADDPVAAKLFVPRAPANPKPS